MGLFIKSSLCSSHASGGMLHAVLKHLLFLLFPSYTIVNMCISNFQVAARSQLDGVDPEACAFTTPAKMASPASVISVWPSVSKGTVEHTA